MRRLRDCLLAAAALSALTAPAARAQCLPLSNSAFNINGIVVGTAIVGGGAPPPACASDVGWGGVTGFPFAPVGGAADTHSARFFASSRAAGANLDRLYVGVHVENDDRFTASDVVTLYFHPGASDFAAGKSFALRIEIGPQTPPTDEDCGGNVSSMTYYTFNGTWTPVFTF